MKTEQYFVRTFEVAGQPVRISTYREAGRWYAIADNVSPGAWFGRATGDTRDEAERLAIEKARERLERPQQPV